MAVANTWRATAQAVTFASGKCMCFVFNAHASRKVRVRRAYQLNNSTSAVTGVVTTMQIKRLTTGVGSAGTTITALAHDTANSALSSVTCGHAYTGQTQASGVFRQYLWVNEEPVVAGTTMANWLTLIPYGEVWNAGYADTNVQPFVCNTNEGFQMYHSGSSAVGSNDFEIEFTDEAS